MKEAITNMTGEDYWTPACLMRRRCPSQVVEDSRRLMRKVGVLAHAALKAKRLLDEGAAPQNA